MRLGCAALDGRLEPVLFRALHPRAWLSAQASKHSDRRSCYHGGTGRAGCAGPLDVEAWLESVPLVSASWACRYRKDEALAAPGLLGPRVQPGGRLKWTG